MNDLFQNVITASFHGSIVIGAVCLLRLLLKKTPKKFLCLLWMLAFLRLLMPFQIQSDLSLQPEPERIVQENYLVPPAPEPTGDPAVQMPQTPPVSADGEDYVQEGIFAVVEEEELPSFVSDSRLPAEEPETAKTDLREWIPFIWLVGCSLFFLYCVFSYGKLKLQVREAIRIPGGWESERIDTAFILGFIRPQIYIPMGMPDSVRRHILAHERTHLEKGDHWYKMLGYIALAVHWFNPLVWLAYILLCKDIELACDERVVQFMELAERKEYSAALLRCSTARAHFAACPVAFGEVSVKERIMTVLHYRKPSFWISLLGVIAIVFVAVCLMTSPTEKTTAERVADNTEIVDGRRVVTVSDVDEFLAAIGPDTVIELSIGSYNLCNAENYGQETGTMYYSWEQTYDGYELTLYGVENLTISGSGRFVTTLETEPRYSNVIKLESCTNVTLEGFTAGHTKERGECSGGVISLENCSDIQMTGLGLYGCGVVGVIADNSTNISVTDSDIYECSTSALSLYNTNGVTVSDCRIYDIGTNQYGGYTFFSIVDSQAVVISGCEISDSTVSHLMYTSGSNVEMRNNLFANNRARDAAFSIHSGLVVMADDRFADNNIRKWYDGYGNFAVDPNGEPIKTFEQTGTDAEEPAAPQPMLQIHVSTVDELIAAIGPNKEIILDGELYDLSTATGYGTYKGDYYYWEDIYDGPGLVICNVENMVIRSNDGDVTAHTLSAVPRYADVLAFSACKNITLSGFTAGHTREPGSCAGGVLEFRDCDGMTVDNCGLYGCGILGVYAEYSSDITVKNSDIYECSQGGVQFRDTDGITLENNTFRDLGGKEMMFSGSTNITVDGEPWNTDSGTQLPVAFTETDKAYADDLKVLQETAADFTKAYLSGEKQAVKLYLASFYEDEITVYDGDGSVVTPTQVIVAEDYPEDMESMGWCKASVTLTRNDGAVKGLTLEMCREQGIWKVQDYYWGNGEREKLTLAVDNFTYAYFDNDLDMMKEAMIPDYSGTLTGYSGPSGSVYFLDHELAEHIPNKGLESKVSYATAIPFKERAESQTRYLLTLELEKHGEQWLVAEYACEADAVEDLPEGIQIESIQGENYTGNVMLIADPSRVFLGLSTQEGFSTDIPGKRIGEMLEAYPDTVAAVNAGAFFDDGTVSDAVGSHPMGLTVADGEVVWDWGATPGMEGFAGFNSEHVLVVSDRNLSQEEAEELDIRDGCNGIPLIIDMEVQQKVEETNSGYNTRTAIGQRADGTVILMCINGRTAESLGATYADVINEMMTYGAVNACLMQGGSATGMMYRPADALQELQLVTALQLGQSQPRRLPTYWLVSAE